jgi:hypothetical protein
VWALFAATLIYVGSTSAVGGAAATTVIQQFNPPYSDSFSGASNSYGACYGGSPSQSVQTTSTAGGYFQGYAEVQASYALLCSANTAQSQINEGFHVVPSWTWSLSAASGYYYLVADWTFSLNAITLAQACQGVAQISIQIVIGLWDDNSQTNPLLWGSPSVFSLVPGTACQLSSTYGADTYYQFGETSSSPAFTVTSPAVYLNQGSYYVPRSNAVITDFVNCGHSVCSVPSATVLDDVNDGVNGPFTATLDWIQIIT